MAPIVGFWRFMDAVHEMTFPLVSVYLDTPEAEEVKPRPVEGALVADAGPEPGPEPGPIEGAVVANAKPATESAKQSLQSDAVRNKPSRDAHVEQAITNGESSSKMRIRDRGQKEEIRRRNTTALGEEKLAEQVATLKVNTHRLFEDLGGQNRELLQENIKAIRWQDAASMTIKEAKDEAKSRKEEAKAAKKAKIQAAATAKRQLDRSQREVKVSKRNEALVAEEKTRAEAKHREEMSVTEGQIQKLQTELNTEIENGGRSIELTDELSQSNQKMQKELLAKDEELLAKDEKLAAKNTENKVLQDRIDLHDAIIQDIHVEARKDREACNKSSREKIASEKAKQVAERKVDDLEREATTVKVKTEKATKALQTKLDQGLAQETAANTRAAKAEGDAEDLRRELENTELARQNFEEKEGKWAALFASNQAHARHPSQSILTTANNPVPAPKPQIPIIIADEVEVSKPAEKLPKKNRKLLKAPEHQAPTPDPETQGLIKKLEGVIEQWERDWQRAKNEVENWKRNTRRELKQKNQTVLATDRENIRRELDEEKQKSLAAELIVVRGNAKRSLRARLVVKLKSQEQKKLQKLNHRALSERAKGKKAQVEWGFNKRVSPPVEVDRSQLESQIRTQLQSEFQAELSNRKTQLQNDYDINISNFKTQWEVEHPLSQAGLDSKKNGDPENRIEMDEPRASTVARSAEDDMLLASLSRESDETHELFQEIGRIGLPRDSAAYVVLQGLNLAKEAIYNVQCELRNAVPNKNNLLYSAIGVHINEHYIQKLDPTTQGVLIRQANEANRRLEYVQKMLGTNDDVPKDAFLQSLLEGNLAPPQTANGYGNFAAPGTSAFPPTVTGFGNAAAHSTSVLTPVNGSGNAAAPGASGFPLTFNGFGNATAPGTSGFPLTLNGFGNAAAPAQDVVNPFEDCHFSSQLPLDSTHSQNEPTSVDSNANLVPPNNGDIHSSAPGFDLNSDDMGFSDYATPNIDIDIDWNAIPGIVQNAMAAESTKQVSEARQQLRKKFKKTFQPLGPQSEGSAPPMSVNIDTDGDESSHPATEDPSGVIGLGFVPSRSRQAKNPQGQQRGVAPKGRQLAHQAFARKQDVSASLPSQAQHTKAQQTNLQEQVPASQQVGSLGVPRTGFTLEPNHGFGE